MIPLAVPVALGPMVTFNRLEERTRLPGAGGAESLPGAAGDGEVDLARQPGHERGGGEDGLARRRRGRQPKRWAAEEVGNCAVDFGGGNPFYDDRRIYGWRPAWAGLSGKGHE